MRKTIAVLIFALIFSSCARESAVPESTSDQYDYAIAQSMPEEERILTTLPAKIDKDHRYLFYLHGRIVEDMGPDNAVSPEFGKYEYADIVNTLGDRGFVVISEARDKNTDIKKYAEKVAGQVDTLLKAGVPPAHITIVGASKGGAIAHLASSLIKNRDINLVLLAACGPGYHEGFNIDLVGNVLSIFDNKDDKGAGTCTDFFVKSKNINRYKEIDLNNGLGHGILYKPLDEWVEPVIKWASGDHN